MNSYDLAAAEKDPCYAEGKLSTKCLSDNDMNRGMCEKFFANYRECKSFWMNVRVSRKLRGIAPALPLPQEREAIRRKYFENGGKEVPFTADG